MAALEEFQGKLIEWLATRGAQERVAQLLGRSADALSGQAVDSTGAAILPRKPLLELMKEIASMPGGRDFLLQLVRQVLSGYGGKMPTTPLKQAFPESPREFAHMLLREISRGWSAPARVANAFPMPEVPLSFRDSAEGNSQPRLAQITARESVGIPMPTSPATPVLSAAPAPVFRYTLDAGAWTAVAHSTEMRSPGEFTPIRLEGRDGNLRVHFPTLSSVLTPEVTGMLPQKADASHPAFLAAQEFLGEFRSEKFFPELVRDFGQVLKNSGRFELPAAGAAPQGLPAPRELEGLLRMFLSFPVEAATATASQQGRIWSGMQSPMESQLSQWLGHFQPTLATAQPGTGGISAGQSLPNLASNVAPIISQNALPTDAQAVAPTSAPSVSALLTPEMSLSPVLRELPQTVGSPVPSAAPSPEAALEAALQKPPVWERLPEGVTADKLRQWLMEEAAMQPREASARKFLMQALAVQLGKAGDFSEGENHQAQVWHQGQWQGIRVLWRRRETGAGEIDPHKAFVFAVEASMPHLGQVEVKVRVMGEGAHLDFRSENSEARPLLDRAVRDLEARLVHLNFKVLSFSFVDWPTEDVFHVQNGKNTENSSPGKLDIRA